jgi:hypothetical protein
MRPANAKVDDRAITKSETSQYRYNSFRNELLIRRSRLSGTTFVRTIETLDLIR